MGNFPISILLGYFILSFVQSSVVAQGCPNVCRQFRSTTDFECLLAKTRGFKCAVSSCASGWTCKSTIVPKVKITSHSNSTFNADNPLVFIPIDTTFSTNKEDVTLMINNKKVADSQISLTASKITVSTSLVPNTQGNDISLSVYTSGKTDLIKLNEIIWVGTYSLKVNLVDQNGKPFTVESNVEATLADNKKVNATKSTSSGTVTFTNIPDRTIIVKVTSKDNEIGVKGAIGSSGTLVVQMSGPMGPPSKVDNNDFSKDLSGWELPPKTSSAPIAKIVPHKENVGPASSSSPSSSSRYVTVRQLSDKDLELKTKGEGPVSVVRTFETSSRSTAVRVRYRFITSEVPGNWYGSKYNDWFAVSIRSANAGSSIVEADNMNDMGLEAFDFSTGETDWRETIIQLASSFDVVEVVATVANVEDGLYDSRVVIDFVEELSCAEADQQFFALSPTVQAAVIATANEAETATKATGLPGKVGGKASAFYNCNWKCRLVKQIGLKDTLDVPDFFKICGGQEPSLTAMDLFNSVVGREYGETGGDCDDLCLKGISNGDLQLEIKIDNQNN